jgi:cytoskeletal protein RodZ
MDQHTASTTSAGKNRSNTALLLLVLVLLISNVALLYLYMQKRTEGEKTTVELDRTEQERENISIMLREVLDSYDTLRTNHEQTKAEMEAQRERIEQLMDQVKRGNYDLAKARKEAETLRKIMKGYVVTIDSLNRVNQELQAENVTIRQELGEVKGQREALSTKAQELETQIAKGSVLHATSMAAQAIFVRNNGKQVDTDRAKKAEMVKCCFTVGENKVARAGDKVFHMRVISPDGRVLPANDGSGRFTFNGVQGEYSARREVNYQNKPVDVCIFWNGGAELSTGQYIVEIYENGALVDKTGFTLK